MGRHQEEGTMAVQTSAAPAPARAAFYNDPKVRGAFYQFVLLALVAWLVYDFAMNARANLRAQNIASGLGFLEHSAGFGINQTLIPYSEGDTYGRVFLVGLLNTLLVAGLGILFATPLGFLIGIARLSRNWLIARLGTAYVEVIRNLPLLFQILFWYLAVLGTLPPPRQSVSLFGVIYLSNRGIIVPEPLFGPGAGIVGIVFLAGIAGTIVVRIWAKRRQEQTGQQFPVFWTGLGLILGLPLLTMAALGFPISFELPKLRGFNFVGGLRTIPEFVALFIALVSYTAAFIAEIVRAGILAVSHGQTEAALSLGLDRGKTLRFVVVPQALRVIIP